MSNSLRNMIESILITEITRLYDKAIVPPGLSPEDMRKLEILVKIKDLENPDESKNRKINPLNKSVEELMRIASSEPKKKT